MLIGLHSGRRGTFPLYYLSAEEAWEGPAQPEWSAASKARGPAPAFYGFGSEEGVGEKGFPCSRRLPWAGGVAQSICGGLPGKGRATVVHPPGPDRCLHSGFQEGWKGGEGAWRADP